MRVIRWLGAFRESRSLHEALEWTLVEGGCDRIVAAEPIPEGKPSEIKHARVGLEVHPKAVRRVFRSDVASKVKGHNLLPTRRVGPVPSPEWGEAFCAPCYEALVVEGRVTRKARRTVAWWAQRMGLPIRWYKHGHMYTRREVK